MHKTVVAGLLGVIITLAAGTGAAQVVGATTTLGVAGREVTTPLKGWSTRKQILDQAVYNDQHEKGGEVEDVIVAPDQSISYAIVGVGGFLGLGEHSVAIPFTQLKAAEGKFVLRGATKEALKALPKFAYAKAK
jgi:hypothetical protein